jgi:hypothetical protein
MPNRNQSQNQGNQNQGGRNPGTFSPDDDEAQLEGQDPTLADAQPGNRRRNQQQDTGPVSDVEDEEAEDDEDDADGIGARP